MVPKGRGAGHRSAQVNIAACTQGTGVARGRLQGRQTGIGARTEQGRTTAQTRLGTST